MFILDQIKILFIRFMGNQSQAYFGSFRPTDQAWLKEKHEPWGTDDVQGQVFKHMVQRKSNAIEMQKFVFLSLSIFIDKLQKNLRENSMWLERYFSWTIGEILWDFQHLNENLRWISFFCL